MMQILLSVFMIYITSSVTSFEVYWNVPSSTCNKYGIYFNLSRFGIIQNKDDSFFGEHMVILYDPGQFPAFVNESKGATSRQGRSRNQGLPQLGDIKSHLSALRQLVELRIPDKNFAGVGVLDMEKWRPLFRQNFFSGSLGVYQRESKALERRLHPNWPSRLIEQEAERRFEQSGRQFMQQSLQLVREMRPRASWGYYAFPYCFNKALNNSVDCLQTAKTDNDRMSWLFESSSALFPSLYMYMGTANPEYHLDFVYYRLLEAWRLAQNVAPQQPVDTDSPQSCCKPRRPDILPYVWYRYGNMDTYLTVEDLLICLGTPRVMGLRGAVLWGSSGDVNSRERCLRLHTYIEDTLGPTVKYILDTPPEQIRLHIQPAPDRD